ncbi:MAG: hypothetical protein M1819_005867 [Sarea resinae]|nr:MAG: hypothetical protein M1819_005867 [Sarea resinae]
MATIVLGAQWGDEGKGKLVDILCAKTRLCARAQGGNNAGHTIVHEVDGKKVTYDFHLLPSGLTNPDCMNIIGSGVVVNIKDFFKELEALEAKGLRNVRERIVISDRCHVVLDLHQLVDGLEEAELQGKSLGTTRKGIGPTYQTKAARSGIRVSDVFHKELFDSKLRLLASGLKKRYGDLLSYDPEEEIARYDGYRAQLATFVCDVVPLINDAQSKNLPLLVEGANAILLDIDYGTYPFVTSSNTGLGGIFTGLALNPTKIAEVIGVVKAYTTRVGSGPFLSEDLGEVGDKLQTIGREWGVTTKRKRRCGWLDLVVLKYSCAINHYTALNLTKLDILDTFATIKIAVEYRHGDTDEPVPSYPADLELLGKCRVVYHEMAGWQTPTTGAKTYADLPPQAQAYVDFIERFVNVPVKWIGTGPGRESMIVR